MTSLECRIAVQDQPLGNRLRVDPTGGSVPVIPIIAGPRIWRPMLMASVGFLGVMAVHHPMILSGFGRIQTDLGDTRLLNYFMEHGWLWVSRAPRHERFWDGPFFHPVPNVMAYSDSMLSYGPFYWPLRMAGFPPDTAFGIWMVATTVLNYAAGVLLFSRGLGFGARRRRPRPG